MSRKDPARKRVRAFIGFVTDQELKTRLVKLAHRKETSLSDLIRQALLREVEG